MISNFAKITCLVIGCVAGWVVLENLDDLFRGWIPLAAAVIVAIAVFILLYFPLGRPIAEIISDRLAVLAHRGKHIKSGSGLEDIPDGPKLLTCSICGGPGGPICPRCEAQMQRFQE
jgi:hypothetical protein